MIRVAMLWARAHRLPLLLACIAACAYAPAIGWGIPSGKWPATYVWGSDDQVPIQGLQELYHTITGLPGHDLHYPMFHYMLLAAVYAPYLLLLRLTGYWPHVFGEFPAASLRILTLSGRCLSVAMAAGTVLAAFDIGNTLWGRARGILAALFVGLMYPMFYYSRTGNVDGPGLFWMAAGLAVYARILTFGTTLSRCALLAVLAAAAAGTKDSYYAFFVMMPLILVGLHVTNSNWKRYPLPWKSLAMLVAAGIVTYAVTSGFVLGPRRFIEHIRFISGLRANSPVYFGQPPTAAGYWALMIEFLNALITSLSAPMLAAAAAGLFLMPRRQRLVLLAPVAIYVLLIILPMRQAQIRFMLPVSLVFALCAAYGCGRILESPSPWRQKAGVLAAVLICLPLAAYDTELTYEMLRDSRETLAAWIDRHHNAGDSIGYFGPPAKLPRPVTPVQFKLVVPWHGTVLKVRTTPEQVAAMAEMVKASKVNTVLLVEDNWEPENPYGVTCPAGLYERLRNGSLGFHLAAELQTPPLLRWTERPRLDYGPNPRADVFVRDGVAP
jgi:hypothetical protein